MQLKGYLLSLVVFCVFLNRFISQDFLKATKLIKVALSFVVLFLTSSILSSSVLGQIIGPSETCPNSTETYTVGTSGSSYNWLINGGTFNGSNTGASVNVTWGTGTEGYLTVLVGQPTPYRIDFQQQTPNKKTGSLEKGESTLIKQSNDKSGSIQNKTNDDIKDLAVPVGEFTKYTVFVTISALNSGGINGAKTICYNTSAGTLGNASSASGGTGSYAYQWQVSGNNSTWSNISGATGTTYSPGNLMTTKYYRRRVISGSCGTKYTSSVEVTVYDNLLAGSINGDKTICYNTSAGTLGNASSASGGTGSYAYQWQVSDNNSTWSNISGATGVTYSPGNLMTTKYYRRRVISGSCGTKYTSSVEVTVYDNLLAGSINGDKTICYNTSAGTLGNASSAGGGTGSYAYQWQVSDNNSTWSNISGATGATYSPGTLTATKYYRRRVISGSCGEIFTNNILITVNELPLVEAGADLTINSSVGSIVLNGSPVGGDWSGTGINEGYFNPSISGAGSFVLTYNYTDTNGCFNADEMTITVYQDLSLIPDNIEIQALKDLYSYTGGASWTNNTGWPTNNTEWDAIVSVDQITNWYGLTITNGDITGIALSNNNLVGSLPATIKNLSLLALLQLNNNNITGFPDLEGLNLTYLNLSGNPIGSTLPFWITSMTSLETLILEACQLSGELPTDIGNLVNLISLNVFANDLSGSLPSSLGNLTNLSIARLQANGFTGSIPTEMGNMYSLYQLELDRNQLTGSIPDSFGNLTNLVTLSLWSNNLTGQLPSSFGNLTNLKTIKLWSNQLTGPLPETLGNLNKLEVFQLHSGNSFSGTIPQGIMDLPNLQYFYASNNDFEGEVPAPLPTSKLKQLFIGDNKRITGIPDFSALSQFQQLAVQNTLVNFKHLEDNSSVTTFTYDPLANPDELDFIDVNYIENDEALLVNDRSGGVNTSYQWQFMNGGVWNDLDGDVTQDLLLQDAAANLHGRSFRCKMTNASFPTITIYSSVYRMKREVGGVLDAVEIAALKDLYESTDGANWNDNTNWPKTEYEWNAITYIDQVADWHGITIENGDVIGISFTSNNLVGTIPQSLANLYSLRSIELKNMTNLIGALPDMSMSSLEYVYIYMVKLNTFPNWLFNKSSLKSLTLDYAYLTGELPVSITALQNLEVLKISRMGGLNGAVPSDISTLSNLKSLQIYNTGLSGVFPDMDNTMLGDLMIYNNNFSGNLPKLPANVYFFYANDNQFSGSVPTSYLSNSSLSRLKLHNNDLNDIASFLNHPNAANLELSIQGNLLTFDQIEKNLAGPNTHPFASYIYAPQNNPNEVIQIPAQHNLLLVNDRFEGTNNTFQWQKFDGTDWVNVGGDSQQINYTIESALPGEKYRCMIINDWAYGVEIFSSEYNITDYISYNFYAISNGDWNDANVWSLSESGEPTSLKPTRHDLVFIGDFNMTINNSVECKELSINANTNTNVKIIGQEAFLEVYGDIKINNYLIEKQKILQVLDGGRIECK